jgi:uncharacterized CHY-type Zn-finger protein
MNFSGIIFGAKSDEWEFIEPKSDEEFQIQHILSFMGDDAIMVKCRSVNEYSIVMWCRCHDHFSRFFIGKFECGTKESFPVIFGTCVNDDSDGVDFNDDPMKSRRRDLLFH